MYKACTRCGKIHDARHKCYKGIQYRGGNERKLRASYAWTQKSIQIREAAHGLCEVCKDQGIITYGVEVHHIEKLSERQDLLLEDDNLICLCVTHHKQADNNLIDKAYLQRLAKARGS